MTTKTTIPPASKWKPYHQGETGIESPDPRHSRPAYSLDRTGSHAILTVTFCSPNGVIAPAIANGEKRFKIAFCDAVRVALVESPAHVDYVESVEAIARLTTKGNTLRTIAADAAARRDALLTADDDSAFAEAHAEAVAVCDRVERIDAEIARLSKSLASLERPLLYRANQIVQELSLSARAEIDAEVNDLCGIMSASPIDAALERLTELDVYRKMLVSVGPTIGERIAGEIVAQAKAAIPAAPAKPIPQPFVGLIAPTFTLTK